MLNKRGIALTVNFIVILIIAIVVLGFGIFFARSLFTGAEDIRENLDEQTRIEIEQLLNDGSRVAIPFTQQETSKNKPAYFGIGILNILPGEQQFTIRVEHGPGYRIDKSEICDPCTNMMGVLPSVEITYTIEPNKQQKHLLAIMPNDRAERGTYVFNVRVTYSEGLYDFKKIYVKVK